MSEATQQTGRFRLVKCAACGKEFATSRKVARFCSRQCCNAFYNARRPAHGLTKATRAAAARRRAAFLAERDRAAERAASGAGIPLPRVEYRNGRRIERRGTCPICGGFPTSKI